MAGEDAILTMGGDSAGGQDAVKQLGAALEGLGESVGKVSADTKMDEALERTTRAYDDRLDVMDREQQMLEDQLDLLVQQDTLRRESLKVQAETLKAQNEALIAQLRQTQNPFEGFAIAPDMLSPDQAIARANQLSQRYFGRNATDTELRALATAYGGTDGPGGTFSRSRLDAFLQQFIETAPFRVAHAPRERPCSIHYGHGGGRFQGQRPKFGTVVYP